MLIDTTYINTFFGVQSFFRYVEVPRDQKKTGLEVIEEWDERLN